MSTPSNGSPSRMEIIRQFLPISPYVGHLGIQLTARSLVYLDVEVQSASGMSLARGLVTYKLG